MSEKAKTSDLGEIQKKALDSRYGRMAASMLLQYLPKAMLEDLKAKKLAEWMLEREHHILENLEEYQQWDLPPGGAEEMAFAVENVLSYTPEDPERVSKKEMKAAWQIEFPGTNMDQFIE